MSYGSECPGYERPLVFRFHSGQRRRKQPFPPKSPTSPATNINQTPSLASPEASTKVTVAQPAATSARVARQPHLSLEERALAFFFHENYVAPEPGVSSGHLGFLLELYHSSRQTSCLRPSTLAASYLSLSRHHTSPALYLEARKHYGQALRSVHSSLSKRDERKDVMLSAIMLLSLVEVSLD